MKIEPTFKRLFPDAERERRRAGSERDRDKDRGRATEGEERAYGKKEEGERSR